MPGDDGPVVVDTTPLIALALVGRVELLRILYDRVTIPPAVRLELEAGRDRSRAGPDLNATSWIQTVALEDPGQAELLVDLDRGEAEAIVLARERQARLLIIDERLGRRHARRLGLPVTGTLGVCLRAKEAGALAALRPVLDDLDREGFYLSSPVVEEVLRAAGE